MTEKKSNRIIQSYLDNVSPELVLTLTEGIADKTRLAILMALRRKSPQSFTGLKERFNINQSTLNYHLDKLTKSSLVTNYYTKLDDATVYSFYTLSTFGKLLLDKVYEVVDLLEKETAKPLNVKVAKLEEKDLQRAEASLVRVVSPSPSHLVDIEKWKKEIASIVKC